MDIHQINISEINKKNDCIDFKLKKGFLKSLFEYINTGKII